MTETAIAWFRRDLRLHDNPTLAAASDADELLPVYVFDPRRYGEVAFGGAASFEYRKTGPHRARFLRESVADLRSALRTRGSDLVVRTGRPGTVLADLVAETDADRVHHQRFPTSEERGRAEAVASAVRDRGADVERHWTHTLHHPDDLPRPVTEIDDTFTPFRKHVESESEVRDPLRIPSLPPRPPVGSGDLPDWSWMDLEPPDGDDRAALPFAGGESRGLERLHEYVWERDRLRRYKETRNGLLGADYSSKLSPWLAAGCLSPRRVDAEVRDYERDRVENESTYWLVFELRWRDFFQFQFAKHGDRLFAPGGIRERDIDWSCDEAVFQRWAEGETGVPFVDAAMRELNATGYVSNRARQNAASYLANDCRVDWRWGAAYFEAQLVDYDVASNYGNWAYVAGVGNDSRNRSFDVLSQAERYDGDAEYVRTWCPELSELPPEYAHRPWRLSDEEAARYGVELGADYPADPVVDPG